MIYVEKVHVSLQVNVLTAMLPDLKDTPFKTTGRLYEARHRFPIDGL